jgi:hypothetical protein
MNFELGILFFDKKTTILSRTYEGIGMFANDWEKIQSVYWEAMVIEKQFTQQS